MYNFRRNTECIFVCVQPFDHTVRGALSPPHTSRALGSTPQGHARDRDSRAALGNPQDTRHIRQTYSGRSARVATRPESQAAPPHIFNLPRRLSPPSHGSADRRLRPACDIVFSEPSNLVTNRGIGLGPNLGLVQPPGRVVWPFGPYPTLIIR